MTDPGEDISPILLNFHPTATTVSMLAPLELRIDHFATKGQAGRDAIQNGNQGLTVRFTGSQKSEHLSNPLAFGSINPTIGDYR
jgi:hypothetical protein